MSLTVKIKKLNEKAVIPSYSYSTDSGMDLTATSRYFDEQGCVVYGTGLAIEIPENYVGLLFPRSSNAKKDLILSNSVGVIDPGYIGEVTLKYKPSGYFAEYPDKEESLKTDQDFDYITFSKPEGHDSTTELYEVGDRVGQIIIIPRPKVEWEEVYELSVSERGTGGYGSTDNLFQGTTTM